MASGKDRKKAIVMLSGGLDSTVALYWALKKKKWKIQILCFDYFKRSQKEIEAARLISKVSRSPSLELNLEFLREIDDSRRVNLNPYLRRAPSAYVPSRNLIFYGIASSLAEIYDCKFIVGGHNKDDVDSFPDSSSGFFNKFNKLTAMSLYSHARTGRVILPLAKYSKAQVVRLGERLGVPFELTWSCYLQGRKPCGSCLACKRRERAFKEAALLDPAVSLSK